MTLSRLNNFFSFFLLILLSKPICISPLFTNPDSILILGNVFSVVYSVLRKTVKSVHSSTKQIVQSVKIWCIQHVLMLMKEIHVYLYMHTTSICPLEEGYAIYSYDPIMHVKENIINAQKNIQYLPNCIISDNMIATHYHLFFDSKPGIWKFIVAYYTVMIQQVPFVAINNLYFC